MSAEGTIGVHATERLAIGSMCFVRLAGGDDGDEGGLRATAGVSGTRCSAMAWMGDYLYEDDSESSASATNALYAVRDLDASLLKGT